MFWIGKIRQRTLEMSVLPNLRRGSRLVWDDEKLSAEVLWLWQWGLMLPGALRWHCQTSPSGQGFPGCNMTYITSPGSPGKFCDSVILSLFHVHPLLALLSHFLACWTPAPCHSSPSPILSWHFPCPCSMDPRESKKYLLLHPRISPGTGCSSQDKALK